VKDDLITKAIALAVFGGVVYMMYRKAAVTGAFDPADPRNLAYRATNAIGASITGDANFNFGSWLYDVAPWTEKNEGIEAPVDLVQVEDAAGNVWSVPREQAERAGAGAPRQTQWGETPAGAVTGRVIRR
jgi:hypothetical protein